MYVSTNVNTPQRLKKLIERSKIFLNIHYNGPRELEQARISPNISNNCVILSEKSLYNDENIFFIDISLWVCWVVKKVLRILN